MTTYQICGRFRFSDEVGDGDAGSGAQESGRRSEPGLCAGHFDGRVRHLGCDLPVSGEVRGGLPGLRRRGSGHGFQIQEDADSDPSFEEEPMEDDEIASSASMEAPAEEEEPGFQSGEIMADPDEGEEPSAADEEPVSDFDENKEDMEN